ncbi:MAG TPA: DUF4878 domain-containing protein [Paludibacter sp.]|nr:DUF4878 domain-containing protein [Paludibacter sp.]
MKQFKLFSLMLLIILFASCSGGNGPEKVSEKFMKAIYTANFDEAKSLCTEDSKQTIDFIAAFAAQKVDEMKKSDVKFEVTNVEISEDGNSAEVLGVIKGSLDLESGSAIESKEEKVQLKKVDDKWLVENKLK